MLPAYCLHGLSWSGIEPPARVSAMSFTLLLVQSYGRLLRLTVTAHCCETPEALPGLMCQEFSARGTACCRIATARQRGCAAAVTELPAASWGLCCRFSKSATARLLSSLVRAQRERPSATACPRSRSCWTRSCCSCCAACRRARCPRRRPRCSCASALRATSRRAPAVNPNPRRCPRAAALQARAHCGLRAGALLPLTLALHVVPEAATLQLRERGAGYEQARSCNGSAPPVGVHRGCHCSCASAVRATSSCAPAIPLRAGAYVRAQPCCSCLCAP